MSDHHTVNIDRRGEQITISPTRIQVPYKENQPEQMIIWKATNAKILNVQILDGDGSVRPPQRFSDEEWRAVDINSNRTGSPMEFRYSITIDPEIMNDPEPPPDDQLPPPGRAK